MLDLRAARQAAAAGTILAAVLVGSPVPAQPDVSASAPPVSPAPAPSPAPSTVSGPQILGVVITPSTFKAGESVKATVFTTPDVVAVDGHASHYRFTLPKEADGTFSGTSSIPRWTRIFFHGTFKVTFTAHDAQGATTEAWREVTLQ